MTPSLRRMVLDRLEWYDRMNADRPGRGLPLLVPEVTDHFLAYVEEVHPGTDPAEVVALFATVLEERDPTSVAWLRRRLGLFAKTTWNGQAATREELIAWAQQHQPATPLDVVIRCVEVALAGRGALASARVPPRQEPVGSRTPGPAPVRPGDAFMRAVSWREILEPQGWTHLFTRGGVGHWRRPGKTEGESATTNYGGTDTLFVFSGSTVFEPNTVYGKFAAFALLECNGNFKEAAALLRRRGYGSTAVAGQR